jgi:hypothetical protein
MMSLLCGACGGAGVHHGGAGGTSGTDASTSATAVADSASAAIATVGSTGDVSMTTDPTACTCDPCREGTEQVDCIVSFVGSKFNENPYATSCLCESGPKDDLIALNSCGTSECFVPTLIGGSSGATWDTEALTSGEYKRDCLLTALRDRTPGLYGLVQEPAPLTLPRTDWAFWVTIDGDVLRAARDRSSEEGTNSATTMVYDEYRSAERCNLASVDYFQNCLSSSTACTDMTEWFTDCEPSAPACE